MAASAWRFVSLLAAYGSPYGHDCPPYIGTTYFLLRQHVHCHDVPFNNLKKSTKTYGRPWLAQKLGVENVPVLTLTGPRSLMAPHSCSVTIHVCFPFTGRCTTLALNGIYSCMSTCHTSIGSIISSTFSFLSSLSTHPLFSCHRCLFFLLSSLFFFVILFTLFPLLTSLLSSLISLLASLISLLYSHFSIVSSLLLIFLLSSLFSHVSSLTSLLKCLSLFSHLSSSSVFTLLSSLFSLSLSLSLSLSSSLMSLLTFSLLSSLFSLLSPPISCYSSHISLLSSLLSNVHSLLVLGIVWAGPEDNRSSPYRCSSGTVVGVIPLSFLVRDIVAPEEIHQKVCFFQKFCRERAFSSFWYKSRFFLKRCVF